MSFQACDKISFFYCLTSKGIVFLSFICYLNYFLISTADEANGHQWYCFCNEGAFPKIASQSQGGTCFAACNCTSGTVIYFLTNHSF